MTASMTDAIKDAFGAEYEGGQSRDVLYVAGGYTIDYAHHPTNGLNIPHSWIYELRDKGDYG